MFARFSTKQVLCLSLGVIALLLISCGDLGKSGGVSEPPRPPKNSIADKLIRAVDEFSGRQQLGPSIRFVRSMQNTARSGGTNPCGVKDRTDMGAYPASLLLTMLQLGTAVTKAYGRGSSSAKICVEAETATVTIDNAKFTDNKVTANLTMLRRGEDRSYDVKIGYNYRGEIKVLYDDQVDLAKRYTYVIARRTNTGDRRSVEDLDTDSIRGRELIFYGQGPKVWIDGEGREEIGAVSVSGGEDDSGVGYEEVYSQTSGIHSKRFLINKVLHYIEITPSSEKEKVTYYFNNYKSIYGKDNGSTWTSAEVPGFAEDGSPKVDFDNDADVLGQPKKPNSGTPVKKFIDDAGFPNHLSLAKGAEFNGQVEEKLGPDFKLQELRGETDKKTASHNLNLRPS